MKDPSRVRVSGPLEAFAPGFAAELERIGYAPLGATLQLRLMARLSRWLESERLRAAGLTEDVVERFLAERRGGGLSGLRDGAGDRAVAAVSARPRSRAAAGFKRVGDRGGGVAGALRRVSGGRAWRDGRDGRGLRACGAAVCGRDWRRPRAGSAWADGGAGDGVRGRALPAPVARCGEADRHGAAVAAGVFARRGRDRAFAGRRGAVGGVVAAVGAAAGA